MTGHVYIVSARRTAIGTFGGALKGLEPADLATTIVGSAVKEAGLAPDAVDHVIMGQVIPTCPRDAYLARVAAIGSGMPDSVPAMNVNRLCGSGMQAIVSGAQQIMLGDAGIVVAGGCEVMSRAPYSAPDVRWGRKMGDGLLVDWLNGSLTDPFGGGLMGVTAENVAERYGVSRHRQDAYAMESHRRASGALAQGHFANQIEPVEVMAGRKQTSFEVDEHVRHDASVEGLGLLRPIFRKEGTVTAGNASGINDGAAAVTLASQSAVERLGLNPIARIVSYAHVGVDPNFMGIGPVPATRLALARAGLAVADLDIVESNEAFAAQACAVADELGFDPDRTNPNGSGISLGHPVGATGAIITTKLVHELVRTGGRYGLATMCIGGGQGIAMIVEAV